MCTTGGKSLRKKLTATTEGGKRIRGEKETTTSDQRKKNNMELAREKAHTHTHTREWGEAQRE